MKSGKFALYLLISVTAVFIFVFCFFLIDPSLHYHFQQIAWHSDDLFRRYYLAFAGGPAEYMALFVSQFFYSNFLGSTIIAVSGFITAYFVYKTIGLKLGTVKLPFLIIPFVQIILLALMCDYRYHFTVTINIIIVSGFLFLCAIFEKRRGFGFSYHIIITGILIYYISGGMYFLIYMVSSLILSIKSPFKKFLVNGLLIMSVTLIIPIISHRFIFLTSINNAFFRSTPDVAAMLRYERPPVFYAGIAIIPFTVLLSMILFFLPEKRKKVQKVMKKTEKVKIEKSAVRQWGENWKIAFAVQIFLLLISSGAILYMVYNRVEKKKIEIDFHAYNQNWEKVISLSKEIDTYDRMVNFQYNRALANTGQLLNKLYTYEQKLGSQGLFLDKPFTSEVALPNSDIYFDLGNIDESQRFAFESETLMKNSPRVLKRLILNCFIMNKPEAAGTYINILAANPIEKKWVKKYREYIANPDLIAADPLITQKRRDMNKTEGMLGTPPLKLLSQLEKNPANKTAFEYLIAIDLMEHDVASLTEDLKYINQFKYDKLPTALEEAIILFRTQVKNNELFNLIRISDSTTERFREFAKLTSAAKGDREKAKQATSKFKNTYWYYVLFLSPRVTNLKLDTKPVDANY